jgi:hypothetical protein
MNKNTSKKTGGCKAAKLEVRVIAIQFPLLKAMADREKMSPDELASCILEGWLQDIRDKSLGQWFHCQTHFSIEKGA